MSPLVNLKRSAAGLIAAITLCTLQADIAQAKKIAGDRLLDPNRLVEIRIELSPEDWSELCRQTRNPATAFSGLPTESPYTYFKADLWIDGREIKSVGVRKKGFFGSADFQRPSLKVKFDEFVAQDPVKGLSRLTLNNNKQDGSQVSQFLVYQVFRDAGNHAPRSNWAHVIVNGQSLGIYSNVESIKKPFLKRCFDEKSGNLYEATLTDFHPKALARIEVKTNEEENDLGDIKRLTELLAKDGDLDLDELEKTIDLDSFFRHWALESMTGFWDGYASNQNNFFLYFNPKDDGRGYFIPWGADWAFTNRGPFSFGNRGTTVIYAQSILTNRLYHTKGVPERYRATMTRLLDEVWDEDKMLAEIDRIEQLVAPHLHQAQSGTPQAMNEVRDFIRNRREALQQALTHWQPNVPPEPRKPTYTVDVGKASGSFSTTFSEGRPGQAVTGEADIKIELDKKAITFERLTVRAQALQFPGFDGGFGRPPVGGRGGGFGGPRGGFGGQRPGPGGPRGPGFGGPPGRLGQAQNLQTPVNLVFDGTRTGGQSITISLTIDRTAFENVANDSISVTGGFREGSSGGPGGGFGFGGFGGFGGGPNRSVVGDLRLTTSGTKVGDAVVGTIDLRIVETHGGFFQPPRPTGRPRQPVATPAMTLHRALDTDGDATISAAEIERAATSLKRLDSNNDGELSGEELQGGSASRATQPGTGTPGRRPEIDDAAADPMPAKGADSTATKKPPVVMTTDEDHKNMLSQLGVTKLRPGPSGNPQSPNSANYDEDSANPYPDLPEVLILSSGEKVSTADQWWKQRRPEIVEAFEREVLGRVPRNVPQVAWEVKETRESKSGDIDTIEQHVIGVVDNSACPEVEVRISMSLTLPKDAKGSVPVLMMFGWTPFDPMPPWFRDRGPRGPTPESHLIEAGWGYAKLNPGTVQDDSGGFRAFGPNRNQPKRGAGLTRGIIGLTNLGQPRKPDDWGALRAWAWGASRGLDYLETEPKVDKNRIGIEGVSRYGKAALVTLAFDERFTMGLIGSSGEGGASLYRRNFGEAVENLTGSGEYHWMAGNFLKYGAAEASFGSKNAGDLPVDAHQLIALCAPRLTFISYGVPEKGDALWLDQRGSFMAAIAAQPVYRLLGRKALGRGDDYMSEKMPPVNEGIVDGDLAWRQHDGGHTDAPNIPHFINWANARFKAKSAGP